MQAWVAEVIERAPFGATGHDSSRVIFGAAALGKRLQGRRRPGARAAARARHQPHRRRRELRRRRAAHRDVAAAQPRHVLPGHEDRRAHLPRRARGDPPLARPPRRRPGGLDPAAQPGRRDRVGHRAGRRRRPRGGDRGARGGPRALHRRHRPRPVGARDAPAQPGALRRSTPCCCPYNYVQMQDPRYAETFEALAAVCAERNVALQTIKSLAWRRWDGRAAHRRDLVRAAARAGRHRPRRALGARPARGVPAHHRRRRDPAPAARRGRAVRRSDRPTSRWPSWPSGGRLAPLFVLALPSVSR